MKVAVTGTPGVGKTAACALVRSFPVRNVNDLAQEFGAVKGFDRRRKSKEVDVRVLARKIAKLDGDMIIEGHFSHNLGVDLAIVLRCSPRVLAKRLEAKGWSEAKVQENCRGGSRRRGPGRGRGLRPRRLRDRHDPTNASRRRPRDRLDLPRRKGEISSRQC